MQHTVPRSTPAALDLIPGLRKRLQARLAALGIPEERTVSHVARLTHRAVQSVRRWFDARDPGLPDLESFARLCACLGCSADEIIGMTSEAGATSKRMRRFTEVADCIHSMADVLAQHDSLGVPMRVPGDEMAPYLLEGDLVFVDMSANRLAGNGVYALECRGKLIIRRVEQKLGDGFLLKCDNQVYSHQELKNHAMARRLGVKVVGKVYGAVSARVF
ncbi:helix-turn-helix transcriptional regulator [Acidovorax sp. SDU_ACID1]|uniref:helix-turn-helix transcriptional regulator n=1 Tax=Acidovorax sp. SDU_ACID1 TaxID=3136632 RepID=UPI003872DDD0